MKEEHLKLSTSFDPAHARARELRQNVRSALHLPPLLAMGLAAIPLQTTLALPFPAEIELSSLLPANGGDGSQGFVVSGVERDGFIGFSVSGAGDVNGDGIDDVIIGSQTVGAYVVFGRETQLGTFPPVISVQALDGHTGFALREGDFNRGAGQSVSAAGDVNGDGIDDLFIGAPFTPRPRLNAGAAYVVFGRAVGFPAIFPLESLFSRNGGDGSEGFVLTGAAEFDDVGLAVSAAGDVNHDGIGDLLIGAPGLYAGVVQGAVAVVYGRSSALGHDFPAQIVLTSLFPKAGGDGSAGFLISGAAPGGALGHSVSSGGDLNGDGIDDLVVNAPLARNGGTGPNGQAYVVFGRDTSLSKVFPPVFNLERLLPDRGGDGSEGFVLLRASEGVPQSLSSAGDINGDGIGDLIIGNYGLRFPESRLGGDAFVLFGRDAAHGFPPILSSAELLPPRGDGSDGFALLGGVFDYAGSAVSSAGDLNGDGVGDVIVGAYFANTLTGMAYVIFGRNTAQSGNFPGLFQMTDLLSANGGDGSTGFALQGIDIEDLAGKSVRAAGDVNGDGVDDLIVGAPQVSHDQGNEGDAYVIFGRHADVASAKPTR